MGAPRTYNTEAIVLKHSDLGEADRILTLFTPNLGKVRAVARGVRRPKSKLGGHVEPLTRCSFMLSRGRSLDVVSQAQAVESFAALRSDLWLTAHALYLVDLVDAFASEQAESFPVYGLLLDCLRRLSHVRDVELLFRYFEIQLIGHMGFRPQLQACLNCRVKVEPVENYFSSSGGGVLCPDCVHTEPVVQSVSVDAMKVLRLLQRGDLATGERLRLSPELAQELERLVQGYTRYLLERELKSVWFLDRLKKDRAESESRMRS